MAFPSVTYTFTNGSTADATQVNQNFTDVINGISDGTKDLNVNNLTLAGTATLNGNIVLGNSSSKTITFTGSVASSVPVSATNSYDFGSSSLAMRSFYVASSGGFATRLMSAATANWTLTFPTTAGSNLQFLQTDGSGNGAWASLPSEAFQTLNLGLAYSEAANALTIAFKQKDGSTDPAAGTSTSVQIGFRGTSANGGNYNVRTLSAAASVVVASGATLGHASGTVQGIYIYAIDNAGTIEVAVSAKYFDEGQLVSTSAIGAGSNSAQTMYSTSARTNVPCRLVGYATSNQAAAGTWVSALSQLSVGQFFQPVRPGLYLTDVSGSLVFTKGAWSTIKYGTVSKDTINGYSTSTGQYTAKQAGWYSFGASVEIGGVTGNNIIEMRTLLNGTTYSHSGVFKGGSTGDPYASNSIQAGHAGMVYLSENQTFEMQVWFDDSTANRNSTATTGANYFAMAWVGL